MPSCRFNKREKKIVASILGQPCHTSCDCQGLNRCNTRGKMLIKAIYYQITQELARKDLEEKHKTRLGQFAH